jgi:hypothetical protein
VLDGSVAVEHSAASQRRVVLIVAECVAQPGAELVERDLVSPEDAVPG